ncbi:hypothetical protein [Tahibacter soli]|jgi:hypothetical protein|uniref:Uncharacterized protein n=1 Tax=Tahibacter soli TaxID=2983605 RepID=A0A9X3YIU5_9GAMM|nr:hypothetical protein [Tahibacter soli]MDC8012407.1 hypothetical protein [Tahibacter soli]
MKNLVLAASIAGVASGAAHAQLQVPAYDTFQLQARTNLLVNDNGWNLPPGSSFNSISAKIDDARRVAFPVQVVPNGASSSPGLWFGGDGVGGIVFTGPADALIGSSVAMSQDGRVAFTLIETGNGTDGIWRYEHAGGTAARVGTSPVFPSSYGTVMMNGAGDIGFQATMGGGGRAFASMPAAGGAATIHVTDKTLDPSSAYTYLYTPGMHGDRRIVAKVATSPDMTSATEIRGFLPDGSSIVYAQNVGADPGSMFKQFDNSIGVASNLHIAYVATRVSDNRRALYRPAGPWLLAEEDPNGLVRSIASFPPAINYAGLTVFRGRDANGEAIFIAHNLEGVRRLIGKGDRVQTDLGLAQIGQNNDVDSVFSGAPSINDNGDIAFVATLHPDGNNQVEWGTGVFVARATHDRIFRNGFQLPF